MGETDQTQVEELEFLITLFEKHPLDSLRKISKEEGIDYYRLKRLYDKHYKKNLIVSAVYNPNVLGLKSFLAFITVPKESLMEVGYRMSKNPFVMYFNPAYGFKNGINSIMHVPKDQVDRIDEFLSRTSDDYEYYEVRAYPPRESEEVETWIPNYEYARLMDILKVDARIPITEIAKKLGRSRPTVRFMINQLKEKNVLVGFAPYIEMNVHDRGVIGITHSATEDDISRIIERFNEYEISVGVLPGRGYMLEWFFSSGEDLGEKILEFSQFVDKIAIEYIDDTFREINDSRWEMRYSRMVKKDGSGYRSILDF